MNFGLQVLRNIFLVLGSFLVLDRFLIRGRSLLPGRPLCGAVFFLLSLSLVLPRLVFPAAAQVKTEQNCPDARPLSFPKDHGAHRCYQTEWWYYTGHLVEESSGDEQGENKVFTKPSDFGFQFTIFRKSEPGGGSHKFMAHGALSRLSVAREAGIDGASKPSEGAKPELFTFAQVVGDEGVGLAGASDSRLEVWVQDWKAEQFGNKQVLEYELKDGTRIRLIAEEVQPLVLNGDAGKSHKADCPKCFSFYYSMPQLKLSGEIIKGDIIKHVRGIGWMDHEFMSGAMEPGTIGWDWFSLYWPDGASLMAFQLRRSGKESYLAGTHIAANGQVSKLVGSDISLTPSDSWKSKRGVNYPTEWKLVVNKLNLNLELGAIIKEQVVEPEKLQRLESPDKTTKNRDKMPSEYWEGAVEDQKQNIRGYLEMTGYEHPIDNIL